MNDQRETIKTKEDNKPPSLWNNWLPNLNRQKKQSTTETQIIGIAPEELFSSKVAFSNVDNGIRFTKDALGGGDIGSGLIGLAFHNRVLQHVSTRKDIYNATSSLKLKLKRNQPPIQDMKVPLSHEENCEEIDMTTNLILNEHHQPQEQTGMNIIPEEIATFCCGFCKRR